MKKKKLDKTQLVRIETTAVNHVRKFVESTKQSVGGFFSLAATEKIEKEAKLNGKKIST